MQAAPAMLHAGLVARRHRPMPVLVTPAGPPPARRAMTVRVDAALRARLEREKARTGRSFQSLMAEALTRALPP